VRIAEVIGTVTLSRGHASVAGSRWVIGVPCSLAALQNKGQGDGEDLVIYDMLGAGSGCLIGFSEGGEAAAPFYPDRRPVDAYAACIIDQIAMPKS
jgi:ethanolamine utilization protein EutN